MSSLEEVLRLLVGHDPDIFALSLWSLHGIGQVPGQDAPLNRRFEGTVQYAVADPGPATMEQFMRRWMAEYVKTSLKSSTFESYRQMVEDHIIPGLGNIKLAKLRPDQIQMRS